MKVGDDKIRIVHVNIEPDGGHKGQLVRGDVEQRGRKAGGLEAELVHELRNKRLGLTQTKVNSSWGLTRTTVKDQVKLLGMNGLIDLVIPRGGETLLVRGGEVLGRRVDITLEATVAGALGGLRVVVIVAALGLLSAAVDPDELRRHHRG